MTQNYTSPNGTINIDIPPGFTYEASSELLEVRRGERTVFTIGTNVKDDQSGVQASQIQGYTALGRATDSFQTWHIPELHMSLQWPAIHAKTAARFQKLLRLPVESLSLLPARLSAPAVLANTTLIPETDTLGAIDPALHEAVLSASNLRGYKRQPVAIDESILTALENGERLHPDALQSWDEMRQAVIAETGVSLTVTSGYRSVPEQSALFMARLGNIDSLVAQSTLGQIRSLNNVMIQAAPPGYSRHHSGYAIDIMDVTNALALFKITDSPGYQWLAADDYTNARAFGWHPSYPADGPAQGPTPEPWELLWRPPIL